MRSNEIKVLQRAHKLEHRSVNAGRVHSSLQRRYDKLIRNQNVRTEENPQSNSGTTATKRLEELFGKIDLPSK